MQQRAFPADLLSRPQNMRRPVLLSRLGVRYLDRPPGMLHPRKDMRQTVLRARAALRFLLEHSPMLSRGPNVRSQLLRFRGVVRPFHESPAVLSRIQGLWRQVLPTGAALRSAHAGVLFRGAELRRLLLQGGRVMHARHRLSALLPQQHGVRRHVLPERGPPLLQGTPKRNRERLLLRSFPRRLRL